jgi:plastocyanin
MRRWLALVLGVILGISFVAVSFADDKDKDKKSGKSVKVTMIDNKFKPTDITITVGDSITWTNDGCNKHTATSDKGVDKENAFDTKDVLSGKSSDPITFKKAGKVPYHCNYHPGVMKGTITVKEKAARKK